jgi:tRNA(adenine34) deaminase
VGQGSLIASGIRGKGYNGPAEVGVTHETQMREAMRLAENAAGMDEIPVGAVIYRDSLLLGQGFNRNIESSDPTAHAEIVALREACGYFQNYRLPGAVLYVTLEPCLMCFTALIHARLDLLVYGASDPKTGFTRFLDAPRIAQFNHEMRIVGGVLAEECGQQVRDFFRAKRERGKRKWMKTSET